LVTLSGLLLLTLIPTLRTLSQLQECQNGDTACTTDSWKAVSHYFGAVSTALLATAFLFIGACIGTGNFLAMAPYQKTRNIAMGIGFLVSLALCITQFNYRANVIQAENNTLAGTNGDAVSPESLQHAIDLIKIGFAEIAVAASAPLLGAGTLAMMISKKFVGPNPASLNNATETSRLLQNNHRTAPATTSKVKSFGSTTTS